MENKQAVVLEYAIKRNSGWAGELKKGQILRVAGTSIADLVAFNQKDLTERFDQARTKVYNRKIFISSGDVLMTKFNHPLMTILEDTFIEGTHDLQHGMCSRSRFELAAKEGRLAEYYFREIPVNEIPDHGCFENLIEALKPWKIAPCDIPSPFNLYQNVAIEPVSGLMTNRLTRPKPGTYVEFRIEMDSLVGISSCPDLWAGGNRGIDVTVYRDRSE